MRLRGGAKEPAETESEPSRRMARNTARLQELAREVAKTQKFALYWRRVPGVKAMLHEFIFGSKADADVRARQIEEMCGGTVEVVDMTLEGQPPYTID